MMPSHYRVRSEGSDPVSRHRVGDVRTQAILPRHIDRATDQTFDRCGGAGIVEQVADDVAVDVDEDVDVTVWPLLAAGERAEDRCMAHAKALQLATVRLQATENVEEGRGIEPRGRFAREIVEDRSFEIVREIHASPLPTAPRGGDHFLVEAKRDDFAHGSRS